MPAGAVRFHSARRLLRVIAALQGEASSRNGNLSFLDLVAATAGMDIRNPRVLGRAQAILELPRHVARDLDTLDDERARHAEPGIRILLSTITPENLLRPWSDICLDIDEKGVPALTICSLLLDTLDGEREIDKAELAAIAEDAKIILDEVRLSESIPADLLEFVESALVAIIGAIDEYGLKGSAVVEHAVDRAIGRAVRERWFGATAAGQGLLGKLGKILARVAFVVAVANDVHSFPEIVNDVVDGVVKVINVDHPEAGTGAQSSA